MPGTASSSPCPRASKAPPRGCGGRSPKKRTPLARGHSVACLLWRSVFSFLSACDRIAEAFGRPRIRLSRFLILASFLKSRPRPLASSLRPVQAFVGKQVQRACQGSANRRPCDMSYLRRSSTVTWCALCELWHPGRCALRRPARLRFHPQCQFHRRILPQSACESGLPDGVNL
jgi:hypothetical protein